MLHFKLTKKAAAFAAVFVLMAAVAANAGFKREYKMQVTVGPKLYWGMGATKFAELVKEKTNGQIIVKPYFGSALLKGAQLKSSQMVAKGVIDCAIDSTINISPVIPEANIFHLPFFLNDFETLDKVKFGQAGEAVFAAMRAKRIEPLGWAENGFRQLTNSKVLVRTPADMKGLRIRVVGNPLFIDTFRALGADPVNMNWGDAVAGFQQGVVDGQENPVGVLIPIQIYQYHKYATMWNYVVDPLIIYWNQKEWNEFPKDIQDAVLAAAREAGRFETALSRAGLDGDKSLNILKDEFNYTMEVPDPIAFMEGKGMEIHMLTDEEREAFAQATRPVYDKWIQEIGPEVYEKAKADIAK
ncbi:2,3-diketo-L-gulonate-binding periplasmic protein YiaO precursor [Pseudodesulfovibrio hydrargyri]|uniref:2,3-diketo-L-gulonate-binding periplasmic protein YiaO n=1 Tax=Pseudodesulfovibrio hydrargyri TaxID=2125990 RepID=A0A1J5MYV4_9BACT|nr:DctP family TRAP transporter solute-binding subunit [Pseudodesulfovibrio hydrargyri]OIQ51693.1 2,3-diketo-L-gulonate-binding periplasmic protein YiaO precursor [Pseudodesulfovibrio hydrargyri]